jgi:peptide subunit release factor 1 (eRF1)
VNSFQGVQSGAGLLKINYDDESPLEQALRKRADRLKDKTYTPTKDELEQNDTEE